MNFIKTVFRIFVFSALISLIGCAFGTREVTLRNSAVESTDTISVSKRHTICFDSLVDKRPDSSIGHVQNGYGMRTAEVVAANNVPSWINKEIRNKLVAAGYEVRNNCPKDTSSLIIEGEILKVYTTAYMTYLGEVTINASILRKQNKLLEKKYSGHKKAGTNWAATEESFRDVLESSLQTAMSTFISDIDSLDQIDLEPDLIIAKAEDEDQNKIEVVTDSLTSPSIIDSTKFKCLAKHGTITKISGPRSISSIKAVMDSMKHKMNSLYKERYELNSSLSGSLCVYFEIDSDGRTKKISIYKNDLNDKPMEEKLISLLSNKKFKQLEKEFSSTAFCYNLIFTEKIAKSSKGAMIAIIFILAIIPFVISMVNLSNLSKSPY